MLFDLEDFSTMGIISADWDNIIDLQDNGTLSKNGNTVNGGDPSDVWTTHRATRDAYLKAVNEYYLASKTMRPDRFADFELWNTQWNDALIEWGPTSYYFWSAFCSIRFLNGRGYEGGLVGEEGYFTQGVGSEGQLGFVVMTQEIYDAYYSKLAVLGSLVKQLIELAEDSTIVTQ